MKNIFFKTQCHLILRFLHSSLFFFYIQFKSFFKDDSLRLYKFEIVSHILVVKIIFLQFLMLKNCIT